MVSGQFNSRKSVAPDYADSSVDKSGGLNALLHPMVWLFAVMLVGLLPGCAQFEAQKEREPWMRPLLPPSTMMNSVRAPAPSRERQAICIAA
jgi:hypothetical protein